MMDILEREKKLEKILDAFLLTGEVVDMMRKVKPGITSTTIWHWCRDGTFIALQKGSIWIIERESVQEVLRIQQGKELRK